MSNEQLEIQEIIAERVTAVKKKDVEKATIHFSKDVISYDVVDPLEYAGIDSLKQRLTNWLSTLAEIVDFEITNVRIKSSPEIAYCNSLNHINAMRGDGKKLDMWWRETTCYTKTNERWEITHVHTSVPFNAETGKASLDLKPSSLLQNANA